MDPNETVDSGDDPGSTFELASDRRKKWDFLLEDTKGDIYLVESGMVETKNYGPIGFVTRVSAKGIELESVYFDPGGPLYPHAIAEHPSGGFVLVGTRDHGGYTNAYAARISFQSGGSIHWTEEFGTDVAHEDSGFLGLVGVQGGYHLFGYGGKSFGEQIALRTFVDTHGKGGSLSLEFEDPEGDESEFGNGAISASGDVVIVGSYGDFELTDWKWAGHVLLIGNGETIYRRLDSSSRLNGGGFDEAGRLYVFGNAETDPATYASDVYIAELDTSNLDVIWEKRVDYLHEDFIVAGDVNVNGDLALAWHSFDGHIQTSYVGKFDSSGNEIWVRDFVAKEVLDVVFGKDGEHIFACGRALPRQDGKDYRGWLIKLNGEGGV